MDRRFKGKIGEQKVILRALEKGWQISVAIVPARYDLILDDGKRLYRTQVKFSTGKPTRATGSVAICLRRRGQCYKTDEVDLLLVYLPAIDKVLAFKPEIFCGLSTLTVRLTASKNNQKSGIHAVEDFLW